MPEHAERPAGSPAAGEPAFLVVGKIRRPHGVSGDVLVEVYTDHPERLQAGGKVYAGENHLPLTISRQRSHNDGILLGFEGLSTPEQVGRFRNQVLSISTADAIELADDEYYFHELMGLSVLDETGDLLGEVTEIIETGANDVYVVTNQAGREVLLPAISDVILDIDLGKKQMKVHLLPGLMDNLDGVS